MEKENGEEGEWLFLGTIEAIDDIYKALDLESFAKNKNSQMA